VGAEIARIIYGMLFIVVIIFMPNGIMEFFGRRRRVHLVAEEVSES
jgi:ABC-type branched-subunit amino acid transport system permease subunit